jgi:pimeloyl-[acyl-carrier protein] methyl ester esterase
MKLGLAFFHGWGLDAHFWQPLAARLPQYPHTFCDAGYFGNPQMPYWAAADRWVGVGHSLGFAHALQTPPPQGWAGLVSVAGFTRFCATPVGGGAQTGQPRRVVERMVRAFAREPHAVLAEFLARCQLASLVPTPSVPWHDRLAVDLAALRDIDVSAALQATTAPLLALAARNDAIVTSDLTEATFAQRPATRLVWRPTGGHALGHAGADDCAHATIQFLETV